MTVSAYTFRYRMWTVNIYIYMYCATRSVRLVLDGLHKREPAGHADWAGFGALQGGPHAAPDVDGTVVLVSLRRDLHLLHDELQEVVLLLQQAGHLLHPSEGGWVGGGRVTFSGFFFSFFPPSAFVMAKLQPLGAAHASETTAPCRLGHNGALCYRTRTWVWRAPSAPHLYFCLLNSVSISVHLCDLACTRLHTSSRSSKPNTICFRKPCKCRGERNKRVTRWEAGRRPAWSSSCDVLPGLDQLWSTCGWDGWWSSSCPLASRTSKAASLPKQCEVQSKVSGSHFQSIRSIIWLLI